MKKYNGLLIERSKIEETIKEFVSNVSNNYSIDKELKNEPNQQYRYTIKVDDEQFQVDFYFKKDGKTSMNPIGKDEQLKNSTDLCEYIYENIVCKDATKGTFSIIIPKERYELLKTYLCSLEGTTVQRNERVNMNRGDMLQLISEIGDKITLIYYEGTSKLWFDGFLLRLHAEVICFLGAYEKISVIHTSISLVNEQLIEKKIATLLKQSYNNLDTVLKNLLYDSIAQITYKVPSKDYSVWAFPALKALEGRIKDILFRNHIIINDKKGFSINRQPVFVLDASIPDKYIVNSGIVSGLNGDTLNELSECYSFFAKHRHILFHTKQILPATKVITIPNESELIVFEVCKLFEQSYLKLGY